MHRQNRLPSAEEDLEVPTLLRSESDALFCQPSLEFRALHRATFRTFLIVHIFVYRCKAFSDHCVSR
jgi:hypothetical protein